MATIPHYSTIPNAAYFDNSLLEVERKTLFGDSWQLVAVTFEIENDGDFIARNVLGVPVIIWNTGGEYHAYINVCPHRHSMLVPEDNKGSGNTMRCPYHGWEFNGKGNVCKIPDAECFKGLKKEGTHALQPIQIERLGNFLFIRLKENKSQNLQQFMGDQIYTGLMALTQWAQRLVSYRSADLACNWKLIFENSIEDYHSPIVHANTLGKGLVLKNANLIYQKADAGNGALMSGHAKGESKIFNVNSPIAAISLFNGLHATIARSPITIIAIEQTLPITATTCQRRVWVFGRKRLDVLAQEQVKKDAYEIQLEDEILMANMQKGKENATTAQLLGAYEERISFFHDYLTTKCNY